ncbi:MAG: hypothetical protein NTW29_07970 [Bacteroidetes bacterium]|nr:hypothetical protein [Bacteroidota bacterium]
MQENTFPLDDSMFNSRLSFRRLVAMLKKNIAEGNPGMQKLYGQVVAEFDKYPHLLETIHELSVLQPHKELIEELLSAVFPPTTANYMYGILFPFKNLAVYASPLFKQLLVKPGTNQIVIPFHQSYENMDREKLQFAYGMILKKYMGYDSPETSRSIYPFDDEKTGLTRYMELRLDGRFIDVLPLGEMPEMPHSMLDQVYNRILTLEELMQHIPLNKFVFEGLTVIRINDVTREAVIAEMKNRLLDINALPEATNFAELEKHIQDLIGLKDLTIGVTPFFKIKGHYVYSDMHDHNSLLFRHVLHGAEKDEISDYCKLLFRENSQPILFETLDEQVANEVQCLPYYYKNGARSIIICPLKQNNELLGMLEIMAPIPGHLRPPHIGKIEDALPLFTLGLEKSLELLNNEVERVIRKKFTAVQPSVEWKFTEAALNYIITKRKRDDVKIDRISFPDVYPLYGAIDIRNSSTERSRSIQRDILDQLHMAKKVVVKAQQETSLPLLQEIEFKLDKFIHAASDVLQSEEELSIREFMQIQVTSVFHHLRAAGAKLKNEIDEYFAALDPQLGMLYHHRKAYEQSISRINDTLAHFIDKEQAAAQKVYPHYFDRFVTDGLEFNIFMGQSISPRKKFDEIYLRNMKMWQLTVLAKAARVTYELERDLSHQLSTTQLILSHSEPLAILFRTEERKFDVDGAYNIRYEIVKKRIDKVRIKDTNERLTQPGKIAIVYSQSRDAAEYSEYIEFLQNKKLLSPGIEHHDLEELQGVSGLKALRVNVHLEDIKKPQAVELSETTSDQLLGK